MSKSAVVIIIFSVLTFAMIVIAAVETRKEDKGVSCERYGGVPLSQLPARCFEYFGVTKVMVGK